MSETQCGEQASGIRHNWPDGLGSGGPLAATSCRNGGTSSSPFASLNMGARSGDDLAKVRENRRRFFARYGIDPRTVVLGRQVHSADVAYVTEDEAGAGVADPETAVTDVDALIANEAGLTLGVFAADCAPVLLFDPVTASAGTVHAGRKGVAQGIVSATVAKMNQSFGARPQDLHAIIGPAIGGCCYEVSLDILDAFRDRYGARTVYGRNLDLPTAITIELAEVGLLSDRVVASESCTACQSDLFFSHRREGYPCGRMLTVLSLESVQTLPDLPAR